MATLTATLPNNVGDTVTARNLDVIVVGSAVYPPEDTTATVGALGALSLTLITPASGAARYVVTLPAETGRQRPRVLIAVEADDTDLATLIAAGLEEYEAGDVQTLLSLYATLAAFDAHTADTTAVHGIADTSALATTAALTAHTGNVANPHAVTAAQAGALAIASNLSDLASASTARTNLGLGSAALEAAAAFALARHVTAQTLTDAASIAWDTSAGHLASVTLGGNRTLAAPTNGVAGTYILRVTQDGTGSRALAYNAAFKWAGGSAPVLSTTAGAVDILTFASPDGATFYGGDALKAFV
jgi:hypothetical protein